MAEFWLGLFLFFWLLAVALSQAVEKTTEIAKKVAENETVQEAGKGLLARWLDSIWR